MKKKNHLLAIIIVVVLIALIYPTETYAWDIFGGVKNAFAKVMWGFTFIGLNLFLWVLQFIGSLLESIASIQNFFSDGVNAAWAATRDFANLFFALMLLFIAIATVLDINQYSAKNMLPKFFTVALLINFSKAIVGVFIDISQIIMFEFYNAIGGNITNNAMSLSQLFYFHKGVPEGMNGAEAWMNGAILNMIMIFLIIIMISVFIMGTLTLAIRLVTLWVLISLAPLAFVSMMVPPLRGGYSKWSNSLQEQLVKGPTFMFFTWLGFIVLKATTDTLYTPTNDLAGSGIDASFSSFFRDGGPFIGFTLTAIFLYLANTIATEAASAAPVVGKQVGDFGRKLAGVATLGAAGYFGLSNVKTFGKGQEGLLQNTKSLATSALAPGAAVAALATGGIAAPLAIGLGAAAAAKANNSKYAKRLRYGFEKREEEWKEGKSLGSRYFSAEAKEKLYKDWKEKRDVFIAEEARQNGTLDSNPALQKVLAAEEARILENYKGEENADKVIEDIEKAIKKGDLVTARALKTHLNSLGEINKLLNANGSFADIAEEYASEADQLAAFDKKYLKIGNSKYDRSYQVRNRNIAKSKKGMEAFGDAPSATLTPGVVNDPTKSDLFQEYKSGSISENAKKFSDNLFSKRSINPTTGKFEFDGKGNSKYEFDIVAFDDFVSGRSIGELENPDTWKSMNQSLKTIIITALKGSGLKKSDAGHTAAAWRGIEP
jgi:hypothetical protein